MNNLNRDAFCDINVDLAHVDVVLMTAKVVDGNGHVVCMLATRRAERLLAKWEGSFDDFQEARDIRLSYDIQKSIA